MKFILIAFVSLISALCFSADESKDLVVGEKIRVRTTPYKSFPLPRKMIDDKKAMEALPKMPCQALARLKMIDFSENRKSFADALRKASDKAISNDVKLRKIYFDFELDFRESVVLIERSDFRYFQGVMSRQKNPLDLEDRSKEVPLKICEAMPVITFKIVTNDGFMYQVPLPTTFIWEDETKTRICRVLDEDAARKILDKFVDKHVDWMNSVTKIDLKKEKRSMERKKHPSYEDFSDFSTPVDSNDVKVNVQ